MRRHAQMHVTSLCLPACLLPGSPSPPPPHRFCLVPPPPPLPPRFCLVPLTPPLPPRFCLVPMTPPLPPRFCLVPMMPPPSMLLAGATPGPPPKLPSPPPPSMQVRYRDGRVVSSKGEKFVIETQGEDWDGGSKGKVMTKGKRGKGYV